MADVKSKYVISSFATPTEADLDYFRGLGDAEQKALIEAEIAKGFEGEPIPVTESTSRDQFRRAMERVTRKYARG
jgi:hypothetical protein